MTSANRNASGGLSVAMVQHSYCGTNAVKDSEENLLQLGGGVVSCWEAFVADLPTPHQKNLVSLAHQQGLLQAYLHPWVHRTVPAPVEKSGPARVELLRRLLSGAPVEWKAFSLRGGEEVRAEGQDSWMISCALRCPDIFLVRELSPDRKANLLAALITEAVEKGLRILFASPQSRFIDEVLEKITVRDDVFAFRCLSQKEVLGDFPVTIRPLTFPERSRVLQERSLHCARQALQESQRQMHLFQTAESAWPRVLTLSDHARDLAKQLSRLNQWREATPARVEARTNAVRSTGSDSGSAATDEEAALFSPDFLSRLSACHGNGERILQGLETDLAALQTRRSQQTDELAQLQTQLVPLRPVAAARSKNRWWTVSWWKAFFQPSLLKIWADLSTREAELQHQLDQTDVMIRDKETDKTTAREQQSRELEMLTHAETRRQEEFLEHESRVAQDKLKNLSRDWERCLSHIGQEEFRSRGILDDDVRECFDRWEEQYTREKEKAQFLTEWLKYLEESGEILASRLPKLANVVAGTIPAIQRDKHFGEGSKGQSFDWLIIDEAHNVSEAELLKLAGRADRWLLVGRCGGAVAASTTFPKLWYGLHADFVRVHKRWGTDAGRICCRLLPISDRQRVYLESESVADRPEVELRILNMPGSEPEIAEVSFPGDMSLAECKKFIFNELQEVAVQGKHEFCCWIEEQDRIALDFSGSRLPTNSVSIELSPGIVEVFEPVVSTDPDSGSHGLGTTLRIEFDRRSDWTLEKAFSWARQYFQAELVGRTASL
jgi:hypothetical protein